MIIRKQGGKELNFASGDALVFQSGASATAPGGANLLEHAIHLDIADGSADTSYYLTCPFAGTITKIYAVVDGAVSSADMVLTANIGATPITGGAVTITASGSAAGSNGSATPTAANTVSAGTIINIAVTGAGSGGSPRVHVVVVIAR